MYLRPIHWTTLQPARERFLSSERIKRINTILEISGVLARATPPLGPQAFKAYLTSASNRFCQAKRIGEEGALIASNKVMALRKDCRRLEVNAQDRTVCPSFFLTIVLQALSKLDTLIVNQMRRMLVA